LHLDEQISATFADEQAAKKYKTEAIIFASIARIGIALPEITAEAVANSDLFTRNQAIIIARLDGIAATLNNHTATLDNHTATLDNHTATLHNHTAILNNHTATLNNHTATLDNHTVALNNHDVLLANLISNSDAMNTRLFNFRATQLISPILPIMLANGFPPQNFPRNRLLLTNLTPTMVRNLCLAYELPAEPLNAGGATNRQLLYAHLGIPE
jgi:hypothetical protein